MSLKRILGLEAFSLTDEEIMQRLKEAQFKQLHEIVFTSGKKEVKVKICGVEPLGITRGYYPKSE